MLASNGILQVLVILNGSGEDHIPGSYNVQSMEYRVYIYTVLIALLTQSVTNIIKAKSQNNLTHLVHLVGMSAEDNLIYFTD